MILDIVIFRLNKIWCRTPFLASQTHHMYTLKQLSEVGEVTTGMKMKNGQDLWSYSELRLGKGWPLPFMYLFLK